MLLPRAWFFLRGTGLSATPLYAVLGRAVLFTVAASAAARAAMGLVQSPLPTLAVGTLAFGLSAAAMAAFIPDHTSRPP